MLQTINAGIQIIQLYVLRLKRFSTSVSLPSSTVCVVKKAAVQISLQQIVFSIQQFVCLLFQRVIYSCWYTSVIVSCVFVSYVQRSVISFWFIRLVNLLCDVIKVNEGRYVK